MALRDDELVEMRGRNERRGQIEARREAVVAETARRRAALDNELTDATEDLRRLLAEFNDTIDETRAVEKEEERAVSDLALTAKAYKDKREVAMKHHGKLAAEAEAHAKRVADRASFLRGVVARRPDLGPLPACLACSGSTRLDSTPLDDAPGAVAETTRAANEMCARATARLDALRAAAEADARQAPRRGRRLRRARGRGEPRARRRRGVRASRAETRDATRERAEAPGGRDRLERRSPRRTWRTSSAARTRRSATLTSAARRNAGAATARGAREERRGASPH
jgi:hypothetical protein